MNSTAELPPRPKLIIGNWKLNGSKQLMEETLSDLGQALNHPRAPSNIKLALCSPSIYAREMIQHAREVSDKILIGSKNINTDPYTFTGDLSAQALKELGCSLCLVGHAERSFKLNEGNYSYQIKVSQLLQAGIAPALCIGESLEEHLANETSSALKQQLTQSLAGISLSATTPLYIIYEPAYAVSSGQPQAPQFAQTVHALIRKLLAELYGDACANSIGIIYGGSVNHDNALNLMAQPDVDGLLIGCANSNLQHFRAICSKIFTLAPVFNYAAEFNDYSACQPS